MLPWKNSVKSSPQNTPGTGLLLDYEVFGGFLLTVWKNGGIVGMQDNYILYGVSSAFTPASY
jgi:hypothetical protein